MVKKVYKVIKSGNHTTLISVGKYIPADWQYFTVEEVKRTDGQILLRLKKVNIT